MDERTTEDPILRSDTGRFGSHWNNFDSMDESGSRQTTMHLVDADFTIPIENAEQAWSDMQESYVQLDKIKAARERAHRIGATPKKQRIYTARLDLAGYLELLGFGVEVDDDGVHVQAYVGPQWTDDEFNLDFIAGYAQEGSFLLMEERLEIVEPGESTGYEPEWTQDRDHRMFRFEVIDGTLERRDVELT